MAHPFDSMPQGWWRHPTHVRKVRAWESEVYCRSLNRAERSSWRWWLFRMAALCVGAFVAGLLLTHIIVLVVG